MKHANALSVLTVAAVTTCALGMSGHAQQKPTVAIPDPGVPQIMTLEGNYVRAAYNNEGYVILGYQLANNSIGEEWMLLEVGMTVRENKPAYMLKRDAVSLSTPDGKTIPMASQSDYSAAGLRGLENRAKVTRDSINYFPPMASQPCRIGFFADVGTTRAQSWDQVELHHLRACTGRLFFQVPGGITYGQHFLNVQFPGGPIRVPFRILTKDEQKFLSQNYKDIRKQVEEAFKKKS